MLLAEALLAEIDLGSSRVTELSTVIGEAREIVERIGDELGRAHVDAVSAQVLVAMGDLTGAGQLLDHADDARRTLERAIRQATASGLADSAHQLRSQMTLLHLHAGGGWIELPDKW